MAIQNASDLLVYVKTTSSAAQVTRIRVLTTDPITVPEGGTTGTFKVNNLINSSGVIYDGSETSAVTNSGSAVLTELATKFPLWSAGTASSAVVDGDYTYRDFTSSYSGLAPTLEIVSGTATLNEDAIIIEILTPGSSAIFDPVAYSTSASFSTNMDLRDVTNKDSGGWSESLGGLRSFEVSTDILQSINPDVPLDGTDFFDKLKARSLVDLSFSDRIRNILRTNLTQSGVDGFLLGESPISQTNLQTDAFGGNTGSKLSIDSGTSTSSWYRRLQYNIDSGRVQGKYVTWSFYVKGDPSSPNNDTATFWSRTNSADVVPDSFEIISGDGTVSNLTSSNVKKITGLNTGSNNVAANWTKIRITYKIEGIQSASTSFLLAPGLGDAQVANDIIYTSSWQIEFSPEATDYQDPTDITHWQGNALVSSVSFDAGVEDNLTCSATFTGTGNVYPNGLGPELIEDTGFDDSSYWDVNDAAAGASSIVENGYGKIITNGDYTDISKDGILTAGDTYSLTYTVHTNSGGGISIGDVYGDGAGSGGVDLNLQSTASQTYTVQFKANISDLIIKRVGATTIWLSSISLKKVL